MSVFGSAMTLDSTLVWARGETMTVLMRPTHVERDAAAGAVSLAIFAKSAMVAAYR